MGYQRRVHGILVLIIFCCVRLVLSFIFLILTFLCRKKISINREARRPFECGFSTKEERRFPFSLRFFLVALIFLIFDVEILIIFPFLINLIFSYSLINIFIYFVDSFVGTFLRMK